MPFTDKSEKSPNAPTNEGDEANTTPVNGDNTPTQTDTAPAPSDAPVVPSAPVSRYIEMPSGGLQTLARNLYPDDVEDAQKMSQHVADLLNLNRESLRNDTEYRAHQLVRVA